MSIRTNKMKAVPVLLKQLTTARRKFQERGRDETFDRKLEKLRLDLNTIKEVFVEVKKNEEKLLDTLAEVYEKLQRLERRKLDEDMDGICKRIRDSAHNLVPKLIFDESSKEEEDKGGEVFHSSSQELVQPHQNIGQLHHSLKACLSSLLVFPENAVIRKRNAINLWIGQGLLKTTEDKTAEEKGEDTIDNLFECGAIVRHGNRKDPLVNKFQILPILRLQLKIDPLTLPWLQLDRKKVTLGGVDTNNVSLRNIFNIGASYLNFRPRWGTHIGNLEVLQLGRWQDSPFHHIEVGGEEFLNELGILKKLKYLSLRGISRIFELPSSIAQLKSLLILDLKACHNLERLPDDISSMESLTHLIMSECCLLEGMPKGIEKLSNLQVLKGFLISTSEKTPCRISDLANLGKLRRLSINIGSEAMIEEWEFQSLINFSALKHLKISWSVSDPKYGNINVILPPSLRKLHLECFPGKSFEECFIADVLELGYRLSKLYITGGKLESKSLDMIRWNVKILRLKYLKQFNVDIDHLKACFPGLKYVQVKQISNHSYFEREWDFDFLYESDAD